MLSTIHQQSPSGVFAEQFTVMNLKPCLFKTSKQKVKTFARSNRRAGKYERHMLRHHMPSAVCATFLEWHVRLLAPRWHATTWTPFAN